MRRRRERSAWGQPKDSRFQIIHAVVRRRERSGWGQPIATPLEQMGQPKAARRKSDGRQAEQRTKGASEAGGGRDWARRSVDARRYRMGTEPSHPNRTLSVACGLSWIFLHVSPHTRTVELEVSV